jgi:hypothetical protein
MKTIVTSLVALCFAAGLAGHADAASHKKKKRLQASHYGKSYPRAYSYRSDDDDSIGGYYEHRLDAVRFGSQRWWKIYQEQQGGHRR